MFVIKVELKHYTALYFCDASNNSPSLVKMDSPTINSMLKAIDSTNPSRDANTTVGDIRLEDKEVIAMYVLTANTNTYVFEVHYDIASNLRMTVVSCKQT